MRRTIAAAVVAGALVAGSAGAARAQVGSGWTRRSYTERLQYHHTGGPNIEQKSPAPSSFSDNYVSYSNSGGVRTFVLGSRRPGHHPLAADVAAGHGHLPERHHRLVLGRVPGAGLPRLRARGDHRQQRAM